MFALSLHMCFEDDHVHFLTPQNRLRCTYLLFPVTSKLNAQVLKGVINTLNSNCFIAVEFIT